MPLSEERNSLLMAGSATGSEESQVRLARIPRAPATIAPNTPRKKIRIFACAEEAGAFVPTRGTRARSGSTTLDVASRGERRHFANLPSRPWLTVSARAFLRPLPSNRSST